ncbi:PAS domain-containing protein [Parvibaculum sp.]|jgi:hypothetical protein|uniref:PAS domain-containing protein n=1 Tax=Parvibaculum sp. TaxID=2024848 RepID=UPI001B1592D4|nr:PAS domain-containing protein [Parvibaculum sp.]MBO6634460.1 PAS domain-containing protein [Parvibaculum sp.]MBO6678767.1 PAS domain-containing protein [Parvibaculum sp.]MBO6686789.1 PAS domain-containing protein [Parvibaculum sp.]MBO6905615.1 PAS domain-containing protein [Parvibaculum sp.]
MEPTDELIVEAKATKAQLVDLSELSDPVTQYMLRYWMDKKGDRRMPSPDDMNFADFARHSSRITLIGVEHDPQRFTVRLAGEEVIASLGFNPRGRDVLSFNEKLPGLGTLLQGFYAWLLSERRPAAVKGTQDMLDKSYKSYEAVYLPLSNDGERVDRFMDVTVTYLKTLNHRRQSAALRPIGPSVEN